MVKGTLYSNNISILMVKIYRLNNYILFKAEKKKSKLGPHSDKVEAEDKVSHFKVTSIVPLIKNPEAITLKAVENVVVPKKVFYLLFF